MPIRHSTPSSARNGFRSLAEHPNPRMAAARIAGMRLAEFPAQRFICGEVYVGTAAIGCPRSEAPLVFSRPRRKCEGIHKRLLPKPWIVFRFSDQASPHRIVEQVLDLCIQTLRRSQNMIKRFRLPNSSLSVESLVDLMSRSSLDGIHDLCQRTNLHCFIVNERGEDQVHVSRHDDCDLEVKFFSVVVQTACEHDRSHVSRQYPAMVGAERHKMPRIIDLKMRQLPAIKSLRHRRFMWGQPPSAVRGAKLRWF